jgi:hypothetical protein
MARLGVPLGTRTPETLIEEVGRLPGVVQELELSTACCVVHRVLAMFALPGAGPNNAEWRLGPGISDDQCDKLELDCAAFARDMAETALKDLELLPQDESEAPGVPGPPN